MSRIQSLAQRRLELVERSQAQRASLLAAAAPFADKAATIDRLVASARRHPIVTVLGAGAVVLLASKQMFGFATRLLALYALIRR